MIKTELMTKTLAELTEMYNATKVSKPIKLFTKSKADAVERVLGAIAISTAAAPAVKVTKIVKSAVRLTKEGLTVNGKLEKKAAAKKAAAKPAKKASGAPRKMGICWTIAAHLNAGHSPQDTLAAVLKKNPSAQTTIKCVYWVSSKMRQENMYEGASL